MKSIVQQDILDVKYLAEGANNWVCTAAINCCGQPQPVVIKRLKPEVEDKSFALNELDNEIKIHSHLEHENIVSLNGVGYDCNGHKFLVMERLDGGTLAQILGYDDDTKFYNRRRRKFFARSNSPKKNTLPYVKVLKYAHQIAAAIDYLHRNAFDGSMVLHRDLKPDNIGFTTDGTLKVFDFGLSRIIPNSSPYLDEIYELSGQTGSLRYMSPEVANENPYNHKADVYSFGIILWELFTFQKPFESMDCQQYYKKVVHGGKRPSISKKFPDDFAKLLRSCWDADPEKRPTFQRISLVLTEMLNNEISNSSRTRRNFVA